MWCFLTYEVTRVGLCPFAWRQQWGRDECLSSGSGDPPGRSEAERGMLEGAGDPFPQSYRSHAALPEPLRGPPCVSEGTRYFHCKWFCLGLFERCASSWTEDPGAKTCCSVIRLWPLLPSMRRWLLAWSPLPEGLPSVTPKEVVLIAVCHAPSPVLREVRLFPCLVVTSTS